MYTEAQIKAAGLHDFRVFLRQVWDFLNLPEPTPVQNDIAHYLQTGERRILIEAFRGVGKSFITGAFVLWILLLSPQAKIMVVSANQQRADEFSRFCKSCIDGMELLQPLVAEAHQRTSNISFDVRPATPDQSPSVKSVGITGQLTGSRADYIIADDIEVTKNSYTHNLRERIAELVKEYDAVLKPGGRVIYLGTPQTEQSIYNRLPSRGYTVRIWPAEVPSGIDRYNGHLAPYIADMIHRGVPEGTPVDPRRFDKDDLNERLLSYGRSAYALQFMLDTNPSDVDRHPLKLQDLLVYDVDNEVAPVKLVWSKDKKCRLDDLPAGGFDGDYLHRPVWESDEFTPFSSAEEAKFGGTVLFIDPSGRGKDETAYAIVRYHHGMLYLVDLGGFRDGFSQSTLRGLALAAAKYRVNVVSMERNYGGGMFGQLFKPVLHKVCKARVLGPEDMPWASGQKETRILDALEPVVQSHRLVVSRRIIEADAKLQSDDATQKYSFIQQYTRLTRDRGALPHDDRVEAVAEACKYWTDQMDRDQEKSLATHKQRLLMDELKSFVRSAKGRMRRKPKWAGRR